MHRQVWMWTGAGLVAILAAGLLVWRPWATADPCAAALTPTERIPSGVPLEDVAEPDALRVLTTPAAPFGPARTAVPTPRSPELTLGGVVVQSAGNDLVGAVDAGTGKRLWAFEQNGTSYGSAQVRGGLVLLQHPEGSIATAVDIDLKTGEMRGCIALGTGEPAAMGTAVVVANRAVALLRWPTAQTGVLTLVDPTRSEPVWTREVNLGQSFRHGRSAGDTIVFGAAGPDSTSAWELVDDPRNNLEPEALRLYAFSGGDGAPLWNYGHEDFAQQLVSTTADEVVVRSTRHDEARDVFRNRLAVLDARTGEERWSADLPDSSPTYYEQAALYGDVVITSDSDPQRGTHAYLTARDLASGMQLWRIENRVTALDRSAVVGDLALLPANSRRGVEVVNVRTGEPHTVFDGIPVIQVTADGTSIGLHVQLGRDPALITYDRT
ncbi:PQQ-binding-like beta-propeller repeat protein [Saccharomonospora sp. NPDC046836]|uniref:outer membrane protein assembly factor BamB family protein n=1 Tax=Saccharomonospora sp. NPDC046836 TaxID=3156921 RepID=UPI0033D481A6